MPTTIEIEAPDGWICEVVDLGESLFSPREWKRGAKVNGDAPPEPVSPGIRQFIFKSADEAMMCAYRERMQRALWRGKTD
jgi:hypothetical protein